MTAENSNAITKDVHVVGEHASVAVEDGGVITEGSNVLSVEVTVLLRSDTFQ